MSEDAESEELKEKAKKGLVYLLMQRHSQPGCKGWELKRILGRNYQKLIPELIGLCLYQGYQFLVVSSQNPLQFPALASRLAASASAGKLTPSLLSPSALQTLRPRSYCYRHRTIRISISKDMKIFRYRWVKPYRNLSTCT